MMISKQPRYWGLICLPTGKIEELLLSETKPTMYQFFGEHLSKKLWKVEELSVKRIMKNGRFSQKVREKGG